MANLYPVAMSSLQVGDYFMKMTTKKGTGTKKIVKE